MTYWTSETDQQKLARLRAETEQIRQALFTAEAELADRLAELNAFEFEFEARAGHLIDRLDALDQEIDRYSDLIDTVRNRQVFGNAYLSAERQYRRAWQKPDRAAPTPPPRPPSPATEAEIKQLYRRLARRFHPDLAADESDRAYRTDKMAAVNAAYAARSLTELQALSHLPEPVLSGGQGQPGQTAADMARVLEQEILRCRRRMREIKAELQTLKQRPSVQLALEVKLARKRGQDLLGQIAAELEQKVARRIAERDLLKVQIDRLGPDQGFIHIKR